MVFELVALDTIADILIGVPTGAGSRLTTGNVTCVRRRSCPAGGGCTGTAPRTVDNANATLAAGVSASGVGILTYLNERAVSHSTRAD